MQKIKYVDNCCESVCRFSSECAQHVSAGDFRMEDGFSPQLVRINGEVHCKTIDRPVHPHIDYIFYLPDNVDRLDVGYLTNIPEHDDLALVMQTAIDAHAGQFRKNGKTPYIFHPIAVTQLLINWGVADNSVLCAAMCHDVFEDCDPKYRETLADLLSPEAYSYVEEMTRASGVDKEEYIQSFGDKQVPTIVIKLADRICNTQDFMRYKKASGVRYWSAGKPIVQAFYDKVEVSETFTKEMIQNARQDIERINQRCG